MGALHGDFPKERTGLSCNGNRYDALSAHGTRVASFQAGMAAWQAGKLTALLLLERARMPWKLVY